MTETNTTPAEENNEHTAPKEIVDSEGNPVETKDESSEDGQTVESLQKALKDTKAELTKLQQGAKDEGSDEEGDEESKSKENKIPEGEEEKDETQKEAESKGVDFDALSKEYNTDGQLSEESYADLEKKGYSRQVVDDYIEGRVAVNAQQTAQLTEIVGGSDNLQNVLEWAGENMTAEEITTYNEISETGSFAQKKLALEGVYARYSEAEGTTPNLVNGSQTQNSSGDVFRSANAMTKAMEDKRYWTDPDYRAEVTEKAERSYKAGTI